MIAVTIGIGCYAAMAQYAARQLQAKTGLRTLVLDHDHMARTGLHKPHWLKFRLFDLVEEQDVLYFDADLVCLNPWDPSRFVGSDGIVCVRDKLSSAICADAERWGLPAAEYFNTGMFLINRWRHHQWLALAEKLSATPDLPFHDQGPLNGARWQLKLPLRLVHRRYNWVCFGEGPLSYRMGVFMAHRLLPSRNDINTRYYEGQYQPPLQPSIMIDEAETERLKGRLYAFSFMRRPHGTLFLREDGTLLPVARPDGPGHWLVQSVEGKPLLTLTSDAEALCSFRRRSDSEWLSLPPAAPARLLALPAEPTAIEGEYGNKAESMAAERIIRQRWFEYLRVERDQRAMELLPQGVIGTGQGGCEQQWCMQQSEHGPMELLIGGRGQLTCRLAEDKDGVWRGRWLVHEKMPVALRPQECCDGLDAAGGLEVCHV